MRARLLSLGAAAALCAAGCGASPDPDQVAADALGAAQARLSVLRVKVDTNPLVSRGDAAAYAYDLRGEAVELDTIRGLRERLPTELGLEVPAVLLDSQLEITAKRARTLAKTAEGHDVRHTGRAEAAFENATAELDLRIAVLQRLE
jgi:hypothetical protein